jgi:hypothetical protein
MSSAPHRVKIAKSPPMKDCDDRLKRPLLDIPSSIRLRLSHMAATIRIRSRQLDYRISHQYKQHKRFSISKTQKSDPTRGSTAFIWRSDEQGWHKDIMGVEARMGHGELGFFMSFDEDDLSVTPSTPSSSNTPHNLPTKTLNGKRPHIQNVPCLAK